MEAIRESHSGIRKLTDIGSFMVHYIEFIICKLIMIPKISLVSLFIYSFSLYRVT